MSDELKVGDIVQLKSGGPDMTVSYIGDEVYCSYFFQGEMKTVHLDGDAFRKISS